MTWMMMSFDKDRRNDKQEFWIVKEESEVN